MFLIGKIIWKMTTLWKMFCECDHMLDRLTSTNAIDAYHHQTCQFIHAHDTKYSMQPYVIKLDFSWIYISSNILTDI